MSILINGMKMPKEGTFNIVHIYDDGHVSMPFWGKGMQIVSGITAVPVPPHGRLIDADALIRDNGIKEIPEYYEVILEAPIVIPAEDEHTMEEFMYGQEGNPNDGSM